MRHRKSFNHLGRTTAHREAMLSNMATSLIMHKRINTTLAKAKALRSYVEPLITRSKEDTTHNRRLVFSYLQSKEAVTELFRNVSLKIADRPGGYTRIFKLGSRAGDNADMCLIELVDFNETYLKDAKSADGKSKTRRSRAKKKADADTVTEKKTAPAAIAPAPDVVNEPVELADIADVKEEIAITQDVAVEDVPTDMQVPDSEQPETETEENQKEA